ncbi:MAG TPA: TadE/TadG family type IV pilus assembly protein [Pararhizobium sp.]|uniref:vWA domain-containing protein n=1 Tax=Pararhizobium sp. TaxID=1977563 RepID=UPI002CE64D73|nr:TadE/TadG family type IV pilus assembly protein [Pararhizobium sp.]HTO33994.1 TadE/TadG family type IV pilus assembly protein [Pararhizobium sp.]
MAKRSTFLQSCSNLIGDKSGNFAMMAALLVPVVFATGGVAIDMTNMMMAKDQLQDATDAAALAASSALVNEGLTIEKAKALAKDFVKTQSRNYLSADMTDEAKAAFDLALSSNTTADITEKTAAVGNSKTYTVEVSSKLDLPLNALTRLLGKETVEISTVSRSLSSTEAKNALSMFLVLDRSGSMGEDTATINSVSPTKPESYNCGTNNRPKTCTRYVTNYITKIEALKTAGASLLLELKTADSTSTLVRTGGVSYNNTMQAESPLAWGVTGVSSYVGNLTATGSTDSSAAFKNSYNSLLAKNSAGALKEEAEHKLKNGQVPKKYIVFMTDGENNYYDGKQSAANGDKSDTETLDYCTKAKTAGFTVFTIAFMAPDRGQKLLDACATDDTTTEKYYFAAEDADQLNLAFKYIGEKASEVTVRLTQ